MKEKGYLMQGMLRLPKKRCNKPRNHLNIQQINRRKNTNHQMKILNHQPLHPNENTKPPTPNENTKPSTPNENPKPSTPDENSKPPNENT